MTLPPFAVEVTLWKELAPNPRGPVPPLPVLRNSSPSLLSAFLSLYKMHSLWKSVLLLRKDSQGVLCTWGCSGPRHAQGPASLNPECGVGLRAGTSSERVSI